jgi:DedD protein
MDPSKSIKAEGELMKLLLDEKIKHRLIGLAVVISLAAIFAPAVMRQSSQRLEHNFSSTVKLPPKPSAPNVVIIDENDVFKTIKVARVDVPAVPNDAQLPEIAKAQSIESARNGIDTMSQVAQIKPQPKSIQLALNDSTSLSNAGSSSKLKNSLNSQKLVKTNTMPILKKAIYSVQLASFSNLSNAQSLINKLKAKGYKTNLIKTSNSKGSIYKVYAGQLPHREEALRLRTQLASAMQLNGFVVNAGVS